MQSRQLETHGGLRRDVRGKRETKWKMKRVQISSSTLYPANSIHNIYIYISDTLYATIGEA